MTTAINTQGSGKFSSLKPLLIILYKDHLCCSFCDVKVNQYEAHRGPLNTMFTCLKATPLVVATLE